jgi:uncharacterized protein YebE (UPF0316 family)
VTLPLLLSALGIFGLRILDVSLGTLRIGMLVRGRRVLAGLFGFFESLIWLTAAAQVLSHLDSPIKFVAYAGGYAAGTMIGSTLERWLSVGDVIVRIVAPIHTPLVADMLRKEGYFVTVVNAEGRDGDVRVNFSVIPRRKVPQVLKLIEEVNPQAFTTFEETTPMKRSIAPAVSLRK